MLYLFIFLSIVFCSEKSVYVKTPSSITDIGDYPYPNDPMADRAKGYLLSGKAHTATSNYGLY